LRREIAVFVRERGWNRTIDPLLKRQMLYP
jgi:hypothetical protein